MEAQLLAATTTGSTTPAGGGATAQSRRLKWRKPLQRLLQRRHLQKNKAAPSHQSSSDNSLHYFATLKETSENHEEDASTTIYASFSESNTTNNCSFDRSFDSSARGGNDGSMIRSRPGTPPRGPLPNTPPRAGPLLLDEVFELDFFQQQHAELEPNLTDPAAAFSEEFADNDNMNKNNFTNRSVQDDDGGCGDATADAAAAYTIDYDDDDNKEDESSFCQFHLPDASPKRYASAAMVSLCTSITSQDDQSAFVYRVDPKDQGTEVVLFEKEGNDIFMNLSPVREAEFGDSDAALANHLHASDQFTATGAVGDGKTVDASAAAAVAAAAAEQKAPSPVLIAAATAADEDNTNSESAVTWVSHDDDDADDRPVKEIVFANVDATGGIWDAADEDMPHGSSNVRDVIFASFDKTAFPSFPQEEEREPPVANNINAQDDVSDLLDPIIRTSPNQCVNESMDTGVWSGVVASTQTSKSAPPPPQPKKTRRSAAFLKRKSAFTGEDLLTREAESFAVFLEEGLNPAPSPIRKSSTPKSTISPEERLLHALYPSMDISDDEGGRAAAQGSYSASSTAPNSLDGVRRVKPGLFSKSVSFDASFPSQTSFDGNDAANNSYAQSASDYAPSTLPGSVNTRPAPGEDFCYGIFHDNIADDELTVRSDDFSRSPGRNGGGGQRATGSGRTLLTLDQVRLDILYTVQEMAREGSSVMKKLLKH